MRSRIRTGKGEQLPFTTDEFVHGTYNVISDRDGFKYKRSECKMTWDGYLVHKDDWEPRQPQDFVRGRKDDQRAGLDVRPDSYSTVSSNSTTRDDL